MDLDEDEDIEYEDISRTREDEISSTQEETPKKYCYKCKREITLLELKIANPSMDGAYLQKLFESPFIEFYCCDCFEMKTPDSIVRDLIRYLNLLEKNIKYPLKRVWNFKISNYQELELRQYLEQIIRIKNNKPNDLTQDANLILLVKEFIPDFIIEDSTIMIKKTVFYHKFEDYEKAVILMARKSPFFDEMVTGGDSIPIPKRLQTFNFLKAKGFFYKKERWSNRYYLTDFGCRKFFQISLQIEKEIDLFIGLSTSFKIFFNL